MKTTTQRVPRRTNSHFVAPTLARYFRIAALAGVIALAANPARVAEAGGATWNAGNGNWSDTTQWTTTPGGNFPNNGNAGQNWDATVGNGTATLDMDIAIQNFNLSGGTVTGNSNLTVNQLFDWSGGQLQGSGTLNANGGITLDTTSNGYLILSQRTINNAAGQTATFTPTSASVIYLSNGAVINNSGTFQAQNNEAIAYNGGGTFNNSGVFTRNAATGTFTIGNGITFNNTGIVNAQTGTLDLQASDNGSTTGAFKVSSGAALQFDGNYNLIAASSISGAGLVDFNSGTITVGGTYNVTGTSRFSGATVNFNNTITSLGTGPLNVTNGAVNFNSNNLVVPTVNLSGGFLGGSASITSTGLFDWSGGQLQGSGTFNANGGITLDTSANGYLILSQYTINSAAGKTATFTPASASVIYMSNGAVINNNGTFLAENNAAIAYNGGGTFNNAGVFTRNTATGTFTIGNGITFNNIGTVNAQTGTLDLQASDNGNTTGAFKVSAGAALQFDGNYTLAAASSISGAGLVDFNAGTISVGGTYNVTGTSRFTGATVNFNSTITSLGTGPLGLSNGSVNFNSNNLVVSAVNLSGGYLGGSASLTSSGLFDWSGGQLQGSGTFNANGGITLDTSANGYLILSQRTLTNAAGQTATFTPGSNSVLYFSNGAVINNKGTFLAENNEAIAYNGGGTFNNSGIFTRNTATGTFTIGSGITFNNTGTVNAQTGTLDLQASDNGSTSGAFKVSAGAALQFDGNYNLTGGSSISGAGLVDFNSGTITVGGTYNVTGASSFTGAMVNFNHTVTSLGSGPLNVTNGSVNFNSNNLVLSAVNLSGGNLAGSASLTSTGLFDWSGGQLQGSGTFNANGGITLDTSANGYLILSQRTLNNAAGQTATFTPASTSVIYMANGAVINNNGTFLAENNAAINYDGGGSFNNAGVFTRNTATGTFTIGSSIPFNNTGTVNAQTGTLEFDGPITQYSGSTLTGGTWVVSDGATLYFNDGGSAITTNNADVTLGGPGATFAAIDAIAVNTRAFRVLGNANFTAAGSFTNSGTLQLGGGTFSATSLVSNTGGQIVGFGTITAPVQLNATTQVSVTTGGTTLTLAGPVTGTGTGLITFGPGMLVLSNSNSYDGGTTVKSGALQLGNTFALGAPTGSLAVNGGTLDLNGFSPTVGALSGSAGTIITTNLASGTATLTTVSASNTTYAGALSNGAGKLALVKGGSGTLKLTGASSYSGGTTVNAGTLQLGNASALGASTGSLTVNAGTVDLDGFSAKIGALSGGGAALITTTLAGGAVTLTTNSAGNTTYAGRLTDGAGTLALVKTGAGTLALSSANGYSGGTTVNAGDLQLGNVAAMGSSSATLAVNAGTLDLHGFNPTVSALTGSAGGVITSTSNAATLTVNGTANSSYGGALNAGAGALTLSKTGSGTLTLTGVSNLGGNLLTSNLGAVQIAGGKVTDATAIVGDDSTGSAGINSGTWSTTNTFYVGISGSGTVNVSGGKLSDSYGYIGYDANSNGVATVSGGTWSNSNSINVGTSGTGTLNIAGGAVTDGIGHMADFAGSKGTVTISSGSWSNASLIAGESGVGMLTITGGSVTDSSGYIGYNAGSNGAVAISSGTWSSSSSLVIGKSGTGTLTITGGSVTDGYGYIGNSAASSGSAAISGGVWNNTSDLSVGYSGAGALTIAGGSVIDTAGALGVNVGSNGMATITSGTWSTAGGLNIGESGTGTLNIAGGNVSDNYGYIGYNAGSTGAVTVSSGAWNNSGSLLVGKSGAGMLNIGGGSVTDNSGYLGDATGSTGTATISGGTWTNTNLLIVGYFGNGTLNITKGTVSDASGYLGYNAKSNGTATVSGTGSQWTNNSLAIGSSGTGTLTLTNGALLSVTGATTIGSLGTFQLDNLSTFNTGSLTSNGGTIRTLGPVTFAQAATLGAAGVTIDSDGFNSTFSGVFSGAGGLSKVGAGTLTLTGASTYTGATSIKAGTLALMTAASNTASLGNTAITVFSGATFSPILAASHFSTVVNAGTTGAGSAGATLTLSAGSALSMANSPILTFNLQQNNSFAGTAFTVGASTGAAPTLTFDIGNAGTGTDEINVTKTAKVLSTGGTITIGALAGDTSLNAGNYTLISTAGGFSGTAGNGFTLSGTTLAVNGTTYDLSLAQSSTTKEVLTVSVDPPGGAPAAQPAVRALSLAAARPAVALVPLPVAPLAAAPALTGSAAATPNHVAAASPAISGTIASPLAAVAPLARPLVLASVVPAVTGTQAAAPVDPPLDPVAEAPIAADPPAQKDFVDFAQTPNQKAVARALDHEVNTDNGHDFAKVIGNLDSFNTGGLPEVFDEMSPAALGAMTQISVSYADTQFSNLRDRVQDVRNGSTGFSGGSFSSSSAAQTSPVAESLGDGKEGKQVAKEDILRNTPDNPWGVFAAGAGTFVGIDNGSDRLGANFETGGVTLGIDNRVSDHLLVGLFGGYAGTRADIAYGNIDVDSGNIGLFGAYYDGGFYANAIASTALDQYDTTRSIRFADIARAARGDTQGYEFNALLGGGYDFTKGRLRFGPSASVQYTGVKVDGFNEGNAGSLDLGINRQEVSSLKHNLGAGVSYAIPLGGKRTLVPMLSAEWQHEYAESDYDIHAGFRGGQGSRFTTTTAQIGRDAVLVRAGLTANWSERFSTYLSYEGDLGASNYQAHSVMGGLSVSF